MDILFNLNKDFQLQAVHWNSAKINIEVDGF